MATGEDGSPRPVFTDLTPAYTSPRVLMEHGWSVLEPASSWLVDADLAHRVGPWAHSSELHCWPLREWALRASRRGARFGFGRRVTGVRFWSHNRHGVGLYGPASPEHGTAGRWLDTLTPEQLRALVARDLAAATSSASARRPPWESVRQSLALQRYRLTGTDTVQARRAAEGHPRGENARWLLQRRTGELVTTRAGLEKFVKDPEAHRVL